MDSLLERIGAALAGRYDVERELGVGGMAVVYLARDRKHDRHVALKVFKPELSAGMGTERFLREIQVTAKLSHPNILPLYDSGEAGGLLFYVMPYVEGETLADLLAREQQLPIPQALQIGREVAEALGYAHSLGIIHRDIKPQNIMLSGGHAVVADFGIARAVSEAGAAKLTETGMAVGTPAYMSPEQATASEHIDARTDVYSLGCVLYETLVGQPPFTGPTAQAVLARHSMDAVPPPHIVRHSIPPDLEDIVFCALEKSPADRYRTAGEFAEALRAVASGETPARTGSLIQRARRRPAVWWRRAAFGAAGLAVVGVAALIIVLVRPRHAAPAVVGGPDPHDVAVLYLDDRSRDSSLGYAAEGLTEGLIGALSQVPGLHVISRNGVAPYRGGTVRPDSVARALDVGTLVMGSVEPVGDQLRIQLRLVDGGTGVDYARAAFEASAAQLLTARDSVVGEVTRMLRQRLGQELRVRQQRETAPNPEAWAALLRAEHLRKLAEDRVARHDLPGGLSAFRSADSALAGLEAAYKSWADPSVLRAQIAYRRSRLESGQDTVLDAIRAAVTEADRALAIEPNDAKALEVRGTAHYWHYFLGVTPDPKAAAALLQAAKQDLESAVKLDPGLASAHATLSHLDYTQPGGVVSALLEARLAYESDAFLSNASDVLWRLYNASYDLEQFTQARSWCDEGVRRFPDDNRFAQCRLWALTMPGVEPNVSEAWRLVAEVERLAPEADREFDRHWTSMIAAAVLVRAGLPDSARAVLLRARAGADVDPNQQLAFLEAYVRTLLGDDAEAVALLRTMVAGARSEGTPGAAEWAEHWWWRGLQNRPDFQDLVRASR
jgi:TolB-like protein/tRNA A-37 threonylcarbamoyl transferase component Bud32